MRYTDRSRIVTRQSCPRQFYWQYEFRGEGIVAERASVPLVTGGAVHHGCAALLEGKLEDAAVEIAVAKYREEIADARLELNESEAQEYVIAEQMALAEGLVRVVNRRLMPVIRERYEVVWVEKELTTEIIPGVTFMGRPDALLIEKATGGAYVVSWKTKASWAEGKLKERALEDAEHDDQGLSETWLVEGWLSEQSNNHQPMCSSNDPSCGFQAGCDCGTLPSLTDGVMMIWLLKGERKEYPKGSGQWVQWSPLIRGWRKFGPDGEPAFAWKYDWTDSEGVGHRLGKGWDRFDVWAEPGGVAAWINLLDRGEIQPEAGDALGAQVVWPAPFYRHPKQVREWIEEAQSAERKAANAAKGLVEDAFDVDPHGYMACHYPKRRRACSYPSRCQFYKLCWGPTYAAVDPLANGYKRRKPHHEAEEGLK